LGGSKELDDGIVACIFISFVLLGPVVELVPLGKPRFEVLGTWRPLEPEKLSVKVHMELLGALLVVGFQILKHLTDCIFALDVFVGR
jgi:hypothetical protein